MKNLLDKLDTSIVLHVLSLIALLVFAVVSNPNAAETVRAGLQAPGVENRINRYVIAVSANRGGEKKAILRYAESDARSFVKVLREMGGVQGGNVIFVNEPTVAKLREKLDALDGIIASKKNAGGRNEVLVYYSGHADERGLLLDREVYAWKDLRNRVDALHADVKIAVIDACGSGAITRVKGGVAVPAFMVDKSSDMKGYAFITSSTQDESSQESDKLKGSFFTHSLVSGLRGAGDLSGDGKVTLSEAYQFAFNETLQKTEATLGGAQHPSRDMNLAGTGDVVMTDLRSTEAVLVLGDDVEGRLYIRDESGELVAELGKKPGRAMSLGLPAGKYAVNLQKKAEFMGASIALANGRQESLSRKNFKPVEVERTVSRGEIGTPASCASGDTVECSLDSLDKNGKYRVTINAFDHEENPRKGLQVGVFTAKTDSYMLGSQFSLIADIAKKEMHGIQLSGIYNGAHEHFEGVQITDIANYANSFEGVQISSGVNVAVNKSSGTQISAAVNVVTDSLSGVQVSGGLNYANQADVQVSVMNVAGESDVQVSVLNGAGSSGTQVGVLNASGKNEGAQVSVLNVMGSGDGRQVGILNICGHCESTPVGLISIVGNGVWSATTSVNEMGALGISLHLGTAYFYTAIEGARLFEEGSNFKHFSDIHEAGFGFGTQFGRYGNHFELEYMFLNVREDFDAGTGGDDINFHHRLRLGFVHKLFPGFGMTVGGTLNWVYEEGLDKVIIKPRSEYHDDFGSDGHKARFWPGFYAGLVVGRF